ncbi:hypothetical protein ACWEQ8_06040 [Streptomyces noursei]
MSSIVPASLPGPCADSGVGSGWPPAGGWAWSIIVPASLAGAGGAGAGGWAWSTIVPASSAGEG